MPNVQSCTAHPNSWHRLPCPPPRSTSPNPKHTSRTDHNILSLHLLLPAHPPLQSVHQPKTHFPPRQTFHAWKLKHTESKAIFQKDLEVTTTDILPKLQALLDNTAHQTPQQRADAACKLVQTVLPFSSSSVLSSPYSYHKSQVHICVITRLECQKIQHKCASCVKTGLECQNLTRLSRAWVGGAIALRGWP